MPGKRHSAGLALVLCVATGCSTTATILRQEQGLARFQVTSEPAGSMVFVDGQPRGPTPAEVQLSYARVEKRLNPGLRRTGWWLLGSGIAGTVIGAALIAWGATSYSSPSSTGFHTDIVPTVAELTFGSLFALYGLPTLIIGGYLVGTTPIPPPVSDVSPRAFTIVLNVPGDRQRTARLTSLTANALPEFDKIQRLHYSPATGWVAPRLPGTMELVGDRPARLARRVPIAAPQPSSASRPAAPSGAELGAVQDLRQQGEACYRTRRYRCALEKFERAFVLVPSPAMRFNIASAQDKLGLAVLAARQYRRYLQEVGGAASPSAVSHIGKRMKLLLPQIARLRLILRPADAVVILDGLPLTSVDPGAARDELYLSPGTCRLDISRSGHGAKTVRLTSVPGEQRTLEIVLDRQ
jgi:hypothetical protein